MTTDSVGAASQPHDSSTPEGSRRRVDWIELFFDLAIVALVTELASGLHGDPGPVQFVTFLAWSIPAWWAWVNVMVCINALPTLPPRMASMALLVVMAAVGLMAASVTETTERVWAFALANGVLRLVLLALWVYRAKRARHPMLRTFIYNGVSAVLWIASAFVPVPYDFAVWAVAILIEVLLLRAGTGSLSRYVTVDVTHGSERLGLFMIILLGESVLSVVTALSAHWNAISAIAAVFSFAAIALIAWGFFVAGGNVIEDGMAQLDKRGNVAALLDTVMLIPYLIVASVTMLSAGIATAIDHPTQHLPLGAAICLGGGLALFYLTNAVVMARYGSTPGRILPWAVPAVILPSAIVALGSTVTAIAALAATAAIIVVVTVVSGANQRRLDRG
ncbi:MAG: low temperature requirement protein A [Terrimesophilobacter sp.]